MVRKILRGCEYSHAWVAKENKERLDQSESIERLHYRRLVEEAGWIVILSTFAPPAEASTVFSWRRQASADALSSKMKGNSETSDDHKFQKKQRLIHVFTPQKLIMRSGSRTVSNRKFGGPQQSMHGLLQPLVYAST